jgi:AcrR family transcriptional regulator
VDVTPLSGDGAGVLAFVRVLPCEAEAPMTAGHVSKPRRRPKQARSQQIVKAIQEACLRILTEEGPDAVNTNRIAEVAGVNIASLYRYFPNKDAIMAEVYERQLAIEAAMLDALHLRAAEIDALPLDGTVRLLVETYAEHRLRLLGLHEDFYRRHHHEFDLADRLNDRYAQSWLAQSEVWLGSVLERHRADVRVEDIPRACFLILRALGGIMNAAIKHNPAMIRDRAFRDDVTQMLLRYVVRE